MWNVLNFGRQVNMGLLSYKSIIEDAKMRLQMFENISMDRSSELLAKDPTQEGLRLVCKEMVARRNDLRVMPFTKHEEFTLRTIRRVLYLDFLDTHPDIAVSRIIYYSE